MPVFHPARHEAQESRLHLANLGAAEARVGIDGVDDAGGLPPAGAASLVLGAGETRVLTAAGIEAGAAGVAGRFGTGSGRWRLFVSSEVPLQVMSLGYARDGFLANLSRGGPPGPVPAPPARPDLVVEAPSVGDGEAAAAAVFTLSATVRNRGGGEAGATTLRYHRSADDVISASDTQVGAEALAGLAPAAGVGGSVTLTTPSAAGTHYYGACVDAVPDEADTANNCSSPVGVTVLGVKPPKVPDLVVDSASASAAVVAPGGPLTLSATVRNRGGGDAAATTLRYHRSADATITPADAEVGTAPVGALAASGSAGSSTGSRAPSSPGVYHYGACADAVADESDTSNNCSRAVRVTVRAPDPPARPDLVVESPSASAAVVAPGGAVDAVGDGAQPRRRRRGVDDAALPPLGGRGDHAGGRRRGDGPRGRAVGVGERRVVDRIARALVTRRLPLRRLRRRGGGRVGHLEQLLAGGAG